jgi:cytochrome bd-type quinol oxidase subunit 2
MLRDIKFVLRLRRLFTFFAVLAGLYIVFLFVSTNPNWLWFSGHGVGLTRELFQCGKRLGAGALGVILSVSTGIVVMALGSSQRLRRIYLRKTILAYVIALIAIVLAVGDGRDCNFNEIADRYSNARSSR